MPQSHDHSRLLTWAQLALMAACALGLTFCAGPTGPQQGSPEWYWEAALDNFAVSDYAKTIEQLGEAMKAESEMGTKAMFWRAVLTAGMARGYDALANAVISGIEANESLAEEYQNSLNDYRRRTRVNAIAFSESVGKIKSMIDSQESVSFDFPLPEGNGSVSPMLTSLETGNKIEGQIMAMEDQTLTRGIFSAFGELNASGNEFQELVDEAAAGGIEATPEEVAFGVARILLDVAIMFNRENINDPKVRTIVLDMAEQWGEPHYETEEFEERVEDFKFDLENERRDLEGKRRIKRKG